MLDEPLDSVCGATLGTLSRALRALRRRTRPRGGRRRLEVDESGNRPIRTDPAGRAPLAPSAAAIVPERAVAEGYRAVPASRPGRLAPPGPGAIPNFQTCEALRDYPLADGGLRQ